MPAKRIPIVLILGIIAAAASVEARVYVVTLENGKIFETRYPPTVLDDRPGLTQLLTDRGNWIAVKTREIADVEERDDEDGFGREMDTTARFLGWIVVEETEEIDDAESPVEPRYELPEPADPWNYSIERFLGPRGADPTGSLNGIPLDPYDDVYGGYFSLVGPLGDSVDERN